MLTPVPRAEESSRNLRRERRLWHDEERDTPSIGCTNCPDRAVCGGLQLAGSLYDCLDFCCQTPADCDPSADTSQMNSPGVYGRWTVSRSITFRAAPVLAAPILPPLVPVLYHGCKRKLPFQAPGVCLPLYSVIERTNGETRYASATELASGFGITTSVPG